MTSGQAIRDSFLQFYTNKGHTAVSSYPLIPANDPTLLFTVAGMVQFKDYFTGNVVPPYTRAVSIQKCLRAGGKQSDLENVGKTPRHNTFFEMLGNFSFGDYFKKEAIEWGWELCTDVFAIPRDALWVSVYEEDDEAYGIWEKHIGIPKNRIVRLGKSENFWGPAGNAGPCGPCSEIYVDRGSSYDPNGTARCGEENDRFIEIYNLVFTQYNQAKDGSYTDLKQKNIDTGAGLERIAAVLQDVSSNFETDLFMPIIQETERILGVSYSDDIRVPFNVIADHARALTAAFSENVVPSNEGRGYVLRRILRRATRFGKKLGAGEPFLHKLVPVICEMFKNTYPEIGKDGESIQKIFIAEEQRFLSTLDNGMMLLKDIIENVQKRKLTVIPGDEAFKLYDTFGFPIDILRDVAGENDMTVDETGFAQAMQQQRERGKASWVKTGSIERIDEAKLTGIPATEFTGYSGITTDTAIVKIIKNGEFVQQSGEGDTVTVITEKTPFYAESGGQVGDIGRMITASGEIDITDTQKVRNDIFLHIGSVVHGRIMESEAVSLSVAVQYRRAVENNHTATHLLQAALRRILGSHVAQSGSLVTSERLRFDFNHFEAMTREQIKLVEDEVNTIIARDIPVQTDVMDKKKALQSGAMAFFGEKYGENVRVVRVHDFSVELCGGTHVPSTGKIGVFIITAESSIASGIRRIEAVTGGAAIALLRQRLQITETLSRRLNSPPEELPERISTLTNEIKQLRKQKNAIQAQVAAASVDVYLNKACDISGIRCVIASITDADGQTLATLADSIRDKLGSGLVLLGTATGNAVQLICAVTSDLAGSYIHAGEVIKKVAALVDGKGGGQAHLARAGGKSPAQLANALQHAGTIIQECKKM